MESVTETHHATDGSRVSLSIHCGQPELIRVFSERVKQEGVLTGLEAYSASWSTLTGRRSGRGGGTAGPVETSRLAGLREALLGSGVAGCPDDPARTNSPLP